MQILPRTWFFESVIPCSQPGRKQSSYNDTDYFHIPEVECEFKLGCGLFTSLFILSYLIIADKKIARGSVEMPGGRARVV